MQRLSGLLFGVGLVVAPALAHAHARLVTPTPRNNQDGYKEPLLVPACGVARTGTQPVTDIAAGSRYFVEFEETVNHSGCFVVDFSTDNDQTWTQLAVVQHDTSLPTPRPYDTYVDLPAGVTCAQCTMRVRQLMVSDVGCPPASVPSGSTYYSCANIRLVGPDAGTQPMDAGTPDAARPDAAVPQDAAVPRDAAVPDAGRPDAGGADAGRLDAGNGDAGGVDAGLRDAGAADAARPDAGRPDAALVDAGRVDASAVDAAMNGDAAVNVADAGGTAGTPDAASGTPSEPGRRNCACAQPGQGWGNAWVLVVGLWACRRKRAAPGTPR